MRACRPCGAEVSAERGGHLGYPMFLVVCSLLQVTFDISDTASLASGRELSYHNCCMLAVPNTRESCYVGDLVYR
jgi:hypothetical protein